MKDEEEIFDKYAGNYEEILRENIKISGEQPDFFHHYKIRDVKKELVALDFKPAQVLDFGSGVGNSIPYWRQYFPEARLVCAEKSLDSIEVSKNRYPGGETYLPIERSTLPFSDASFDLVFAACVFHHIPETEHATWLAELRRVTRPGGWLIVFEHNPLNPLTLSAVRNCPFDVDARLIRADAFRKRVAAAGWRVPRIRYRLFVPHALAFLRPLERYLVHLPLGAQYYVVSQCPLSDG